MAALSDHNMKTNKQTISIFFGLKNKNWLKGTWRLSQSAIGPRNKNHMPLVAKQIVWFDLEHQ